MEFRLNCLEVVLMELLLGRVMLILQWKMGLWRGGRNGEMEEKGRLLGMCWRKYRDCFWDVVKGLKISKSSKLQLYPL